METERFSKLPLFEGLDGEEIERMIEIGIEVVAAPDDILMQEGEPGNGFYTIASGAFEVVKAGEVVARLEGGSFFGEMSLVNRDSRAASVVCAVEGTLRKFPHKRFDQMLSAGDLAAYKVVLNMARILAARLARLEEEVFHRPRTMGATRRVVVDELEGAPEAD